MTQVVNIKNESYDVYIGRAGKGFDGYFGNPEQLKDHNYNRIACIDAYNRYFYARIQNDAEFKNRVEELKGKKLGCFCMPQMCHGMVIVEYLEKIPPELQISEYEKRHLPLNLFEEME